MYEKPGLFRSAVMSFVLLLALPLWANEGHADDGIEQAVEYRQSIMGVIGWNFKHMAGMMKGKIPYDQKAFAAHARELATAADHNILSGFPEDSDDSDETAAKAEIWMSWDDFEEKLKALRVEAKALDAVAAKGDKEAISQQFGKTGKTCKACHKEYKE